jgi:hypothetical protein
MAGPRYKAVLFPRPKPSSRRRHMPRLPESSQQFFDDHHIPPRAIQLSMAPVNANLPEP